MLLATSHDDETDRVFDLSRSLQHLSKPATVVSVS